MAAYYSTNRVGIEQTMGKEHLPEGMLIMIKGVLKGLLHKELPVSKKDSIDDLFDRFYNENVRKYSSRELNERFSTAENCIKLFLEHLESQKDDASSNRVIETHRSV